MLPEMYDVVIIGGGIIGANVAYALSKYKLHVAVLERKNDVAEGTTKANSAIVHAGYDPEPGTLMAELNVRGAKMVEELADKLSVPYKKTGSLVVAFSKEDLQTLQVLYERGIKNGVANMRLLTAQEALQMEPNLSQEVLGALYAPDGAIVCPWELCIALADTAATNGVQVFLNHTVQSIGKQQNGYLIKTDKGDFSARYVVNAAGVHADSIHNMVAPPSFCIQPNRGEYFLLDKSQGNLVSKIIFQCPTAVGKGVLVAPTTDGNLIVGPSAQGEMDGDSAATTQPGLDFVRSKAAKSVPNINFRDSIRNFAGVRANSDQNDFIIAQAQDAPGFIDLAGIKSPGLSSAPAIAEKAVALLEENGLALNLKDSWSDSRSVVRFKELSIQEKEDLIKKDPRYGRVICRCQTVTEGEIVDAVHSPVPARTIDAV